LLKKLVEKFKSFLEKVGVINKIEFDIDEKLLHKKIMILENVN
jgi:hypothetical protein